MKKLILTGVVGLGLILSGCGGGSSTTSVNNAPTANVSSLTVAVDEGSSDTVDVASIFSDSDGDTLIYTLDMSDGSALPSVYDINSTSGVITVTVPSDTIADGMNVEHNLSVVASDGEANATIYVIATLQDVKNDAKIIASEIVADENVTVGDDLNVSLSITDADGISSVTYSVENSSLVSVVTGVLSDINSDGNYSVFVDTGSLGEGNFTIVVDAVGVDDGENADSNVTKSHDFSVLAVNTAPTWTESSYDTGVTITDAEDTAKVILDLSTVSSDADGDAITYSIVNISVPHSGDQSVWDNSTYIDNGILKVHNLKTNDPFADGTTTVTVKATATGGSNNTDIVFTFDNVQ